ncbi:MAG: peptide chain release factor N(5)-glutamine methyltransferase [Akkermansiaceae bacterium]|jgi:release factor glutamine methyltransferase|nr:peptide chain release factor N(5)-glutamine methyltransferase [Akkermansiaceae bacterium]MDP4645657.1 peptide chain release factor N(5)-glutamine methyltransferase [Akkermansiaceae bacterium]MDP4719904.1 peptide chain release factor N(5)-glutamine methyltransferase [Akkermansiaceae bacterium]MDP4778765.1 peptide chain release factor N(5)-glutamine methyltransferase [Akkermansiaceae bacterium]MDP4847032.1 peptide chain release factor N(5)-glutamine methyltransferase [Akkermansiaceae bacterium
MKSVLETINGGAQYLEKRGVEESRRNMEHLLAHRLGCTRMQLYTQFDRPLDETELAPLRDMLKKRGEGIPLQHLLGDVPFHSRDFICDSRGLIPRPETEELVEMILKTIPSGTLDILDMGCGSGVLGLTLAAERQESHVTLADVSTDALALTGENAAKLGVENISLIHSNLFQSVTGKFDLIAANLPYVPAGEAATMARELQHDPALALFSGADGMDLLQKFIPESVNFLKPGGVVALEIGHDQASQVRECLEKSGFAPIEIHRDLSGIARFPFATHL